LDPAAVIASVIGRATALNDQVNITHETDALPMILGVERMFERVITNLVNNAMRYTQSTVKVSSQVTEKALVITVDDDGPGVHADDRIRIFEPLVRLDPARSRDTGGFGLGLAMSQRIATAYGGRLSCQDSPLGGARFEVRWPLG
jgi:two-component system sensor histidine kinase RstB